jgi:hypothetical protein
LKGNLIEKNNGERSEERVDDPGDSKPNSKHQEEGMPRRILRIPVILKNHVVILVLEEFGNRW